MNELLSELRRNLRSLDGIELSPADAYLVQQAWSWSRGCQDTEPNRDSLRHYAGHVDRIARQAKNANSPGEGL